MSQQAKRAGVEEVGRSHSWLEVGSIYRRLPEAQASLLPQRVPEQVGLLVRELGVLLRPLREQFPQALDPLGTLSIGGNGFNPNGLTVL